MDLSYDSCKDILSRLDEEAEHALFHAETSSGSHSPRDHHSSATDLSSSTSLSPDSMRFMYNDPSSWDQKQAGSPIYNVDSKERPDVEGNQQQHHHHQQHQQQQSWVSYAQGTTMSPVIHNRYTTAVAGPPFSAFSKVEDVDFLADPSDPANSQIFGLGDMSGLPVQADYAFLNNSSGDSLFFQQKTPYNSGIDYREIPTSTFPKSESLMARDGFSSVSWQLGSEPPSNPQSVSANFTGNRPNQAQPSQAQPSQAQTTTQRNHSSSGSEMDMEEAPPPVPSARGTKRKPPDSQGDDQKTRKSRSTAKITKGPKKTAHNMIEKRYRTNLNDKIAQLRDAVPSLRIMAGSSKLADGDEEELDGLTPAHKLNKATVLSKATEYIHHLEKRAKRLSEENEELRHQIKTLEARNSMVSGDNQMRGSMSRPGGGLMSRVVVGGLAGLMVANGIGNPDHTGSRGLMALPLPFSFFSHVHHAGGWFSSEGAILSFLKVFLLFSALVLVFAPGFFDPKPKFDPKSGASSIPELSAAPSLASSLEVRRKAWLTAIQTVWVPRHSFLLELAALGLKFLKLSLRKLVGWDGYALITGTTPEHEAARVKAWLIALDAQLAGGDAELSRSRICLTFLASFTLPATPYRLMLNALHTRVLECSLRSSLLKRLTKWASSYFWAEARKMQASFAKEPENADVLPEYLARLINLDDEEVLLDRIVQRAYNLAYNYNTASEAGQDEGMDTVVEDYAIRTPLDALAAWYSSLLLHKVLISALDVENPDRVHSMKDAMATAIATAPPSSGARVRATYANSFLFGNVDGEELQSIVQDLKVESTPTKGLKSVPRELVPSNAAVTVTYDIRMSLRFAMARHFFKQEGKESIGVDLFREIDCRPKRIANGKAFASGMGLLGFVAVLRFMLLMVQQYPNFGGDPEKIEDVCAMLRLWIGGHKGVAAGIDNNTRRKLTDICVACAKRAGGYSEDDYDIDAGYATADYSEE